MQTYFIRTHHKNYIPKKTHEANILLNFKTFSGLSKIINKSQNIPGFSRTLLKFQDFPGSMGTLWSNISSTIQLSVWNLVKTCSFAGASSIKLVGMSTYVCVCVCVCVSIYIYKKQYNLFKTIHLYFLLNIFVTSFVNISDFQA